MYVNKNIYLSGTPYSDNSNYVYAEMGDEDYCQYFLEEILLNSAKAGEPVSGRVVEISPGVWTLWVEKKGRHWLEEIIERKYSAKYKPTIKDGSGYFAPGTKPITPPNVIPEPSKPTDKKLSVILIGASVLVASLGIIVFIRRQR